MTLHPPSDWRPCSITEHLDGLHADPEMPVWPMTAPPPKPPLEPDIYERRAMSVWD